MLFATDEWLASWAAAANADTRFVAAGAGWHGAVGLVVSGPPAEVFMRLDGDEGRWSAHLVGREAAVVDGCVFTLSADRDAWRAILDHGANPVRALLMGRIRVHGQLSAVLRRLPALTVMVELAALLDTDYGCGPR